MPPEQLLALDTSTDYASVALLRGGHLAAELNWDVGRRHSQELFARLQQLLALCGSAPGELNAIAVALGPGSFNGVRVAVAAARALALALRLPLFGCPTLDVIAFGHFSAGGTLCAVLEAGRGELYAAQYCVSSEAANGCPDPPAGARAPIWEERTEPPVREPMQSLWRTSDFQVVAPHVLAEQLPSGTLICGDWRPQTRRELELALGTRAHFAVGPEGRRASWLAALALARRERGAADEPATIVPVYVRRPAITLSAKAHEQGVGPVEPATPGAAAGPEGDARALCH